MCKVHVLSVCVCGACSVCAVHALSGCFPPESESVWFAELSRKPQAGSWVPWGGEWPGVGKSCLRRWFLETELHSWYSHEDRLGNRRV